MRQVNSESTIACAVAAITCVVATATLLLTTGTVSAGSSPLPNTIQDPWSGESDATVEYEVIYYADGFDIVYTISNETSRDVALPTLRIDDLELGPAVEWLDVASGSTFKQYTLEADAPASTRCYTYPDHVYAPIVVARNADIAVGLALLYPVLEYRHEVTGCLRQPVTGSVWFSSFDLNGTMLPGESRQYTVSARTAPREGWLTTIEPYKEYFQGLYGDRALYSRDAEPVFAVPMSDDQPIDMAWVEAVTRGYTRVARWAGDGPDADNPLHGMPVWTIMDRIAELHASDTSISMPLGSSDLVHQMVPLWAEASDLEHGHALADLLVPGHEIQVDVGRTGAAYAEVLRHPGVTPASRDGHLHADVLRSLHDFASAPQATLYD